MEMATGIKCNANKKGKCETTDGRAGGRTDVYYIGNILWCGFQIVF